MTTVVFQRSLPIRYEVDVFVAGGGPAGVTAAVSAAEPRGQRLLGRGPFLLGWHGHGGPGAGLHARQRRRPFPAGRIWTAGPDAAEKRLAALQVTGNDIEALKRVYDVLLTELA